MTRHLTLDITFEIDDNHSCRMLYVTSNNRLSDADSDAIQRWFKENMCRASRPTSDTDSPTTTEPTSTTQPATPTS